MHRCFLILGPPYFALSLQAKVLMNTKYKNLQCKYRKRNKPAKNAFATVFEKTVGTFFARVFPQTAMGVIPKIFLIILLFLFIPI